MWLAEARYEDGTYIKEYYEDNPEISDADQQYQIEARLIEDKNCVWYSVIWIEEE